MKLILALVALLGLGACADITGWNHEAATPRRSPGLWTVALTYDGSAAAFSVSRMCIDRLNDARLSIGGSLPQSACSTYSWMRDGHAVWRLHSVCTKDGETVSSDLRVIAGPDDRYWGRGQAVVQGSRVATQNGVHAVTLEAARTGNCSGRAARGAS